MPTTDTDMLPMLTLDTVPTDTDTPGMVVTDISARGPLMPSPRLMPLPPLRPPLMLMPTTDTDMLPMPTLDTVPTDTDTPGMVVTDISARGPLMPSPRPMPATDTEATDIGMVDTGPDTSMVKRNFINNAMCARVLD